MVNTPERATSSLLFMQTPPNQQPRRSTPRAPIRKARRALMTKSPSPALAAAIEAMQLDMPSGQE